MPVVFPVPVPVPVPVPFPVPFFGGAPSTKMVLLTRPKKSTLLIDKLGESM